MQGEANRSLLPRALPSKETSRSMSSSPMLRGIAKRWRELHSKDSWKGLLDPLDIDLRKSIISYGELAQAAYDAFNREKRSPHAGACLYGRSDLLAGSGVAAAGNYAVTKFIYATSALPVPDAFLFLPPPALKDAWCRESNWIGYVAVATDEGAAALGRRDVVVAWRGTIKNLEWVNDLDFTKVSAAPVLGAAAAANPDAKVHRGFLSVYTSSNANSKFSKTSARDQVLDEVRRLMALYKDEATSITTTGHSLGASLATLNAADIAANGLNAAAGGSSQPPCPVTAIVFASPRVGNHSFKLALGSFRDLKLLHVKNANDLVHTYPHVGYEDVAVPLPITTGRSPYLRHPGTLQALHNLECYLPSRAFPPTPFLSRRRVEDAPPHIPTPAPLRTGRAGTYSSRPPAPRVLPPELNLLLPTRICCAGRGPPAGREGGGKPAVFARGPRDGDAEVEGGSGGRS